MEAVKTLIREAVRIFHSSKHVLVIDALTVHTVLHADDLAILLNSQPKDIRRLVGPLRTTKLVQVQAKAEAKVGSTRGISREYYWIDTWSVVDMIKYKVMKLRKKVEERYKLDALRKEWRCPVCKAEYEELEILHNIGPDGFTCERCGNTLVQTEQAAEPAGGHEKVRRLNVQLQKLQALLDKIDGQKIDQPDFEQSWAQRKDVSRAKTGHVGNQYIALKADQIRNGQRKVGPEHTDTNALNIVLTSGVDHDAEEEAKKELRKAELARQNQLPVWHTASAISANVAGLKTGESNTNRSTLKIEEADEKKPDVGMQNELDAYLAEMAKEKEQQAQRAAEEDAESVDGDDFEDVVSTSGLGTPLPGIATPSSSQQGPRSINGVKRELESDSGPSSDANTPPAGSFGGAERDVKKVKIEQEAVVKHEDSDDEEDFEDAL